MKIANVANAIGALCLMIGPLTIAGCASCSTARTVTAVGKAVPVTVWLSDCDPTPRYRQDGEGPFPRAWPAAALIVPAEPIRNGAAEATLFLVAAPNLTEASVASQIATAARFAKECRLPARGRWVTLTRHSRPVFILLYDSGGTAGLNVEVFARSVSFDGPTCQSEGFQDHRFRCTFGAQSRLPPYLVDTDHDGSLELLVASELTNASGAEGVPPVYDVWVWRDGGFCRVGELTGDEVASLSDRVPL